jgi:hypothetical protein
MDALDFECLKEAFHRRVDAPMSRVGCSIGEIGQDQGIQLSYDVSL